MHAIVCSSSSHSSMLKDHDGLRDSCWPITLAPSQSIWWSSLCTWAALCYSYISFLTACLCSLTLSLLQCPASFSYVQFLTVLAGNFIDDFFPPVLGYPILDSHLFVCLFCMVWIQLSACLIDRHTLSIFSDKPLTYATHRVLFSLLSLVSHWCWVWLGWLCLLCWG